jgi:hypothetical protein
MDDSTDRFNSTADVIYKLRSNLERYNIPDREYLSVNICKWCEAYIIATTPIIYEVPLSHSHHNMLTTFVGMTVNRGIPPIHCIICKGRNE